MAGRQGVTIAPDWLRPVVVCVVAALHAAVVFGIPWPSAQDAVVTAPIAVTVVPQGTPAPSMEMPDPAEAVEVRPMSTASADSMASESEVVEQTQPTEQTRALPVEVAEAKPVETAAARAPDRLALAVTPPTRTELIDRTEQPEQRPDRQIESTTPPTRDAAEVTATATPVQTPAQRVAPAPLLQLNPAATENSAPESKQVSEAPAAQPANPPSSEAVPVRPDARQVPAVERTGPVQQAMRSEPNEAVMRDRPERGDPAISNEKKPEKEKQEQKKKPSTRSTASTAASSSSPSQQSSVASISGSAASSSYRSLVMAELNRRKFYPSGAREARGVVYVTFAVGSSGAVTSFNISRSSGNGALDGAVLQMMRSVSLPPPPGGSFRATAPVHFDVLR